MVTGERYLLLVISQKFRDLIAPVEISAGLNTEAIASTY